MALLELTWIDLVLMTALAMASSLGVTAGIGFVLVRLPAEFFRDDHPREFWIDRHPVVRIAGLAVKNLVGITLFVIGVVLSMPGVPGPGILTILIAITLLDIPQKRRFERWLIGQPGVFRSLNGLRARFGRPPLQLESISPVVE